MAMLEGYEVNWKRLDVKSSDSDLVEMLVRSPRKLFIFVICKNILRIKVSKKIFYFILKTEALVKRLYSTWNTERTRAEDRVRVLDVAIEFIAI